VLWSFQGVTRVLKGVWIEKSKLELGRGGVDMSVLLHFPIYWRLITSLSSLLPLYLATYPNTTAIQSLIPLCHMASSWFLKLAFKCLHHFAWYISPFFASFLLFFFSWKKKTYVFSYIFTLSASCINYKVV